MSFSECRSISIDYGVMEKAENVYVRCGDFGWSDVGTWGSVYQLSRKDRYANAKSHDRCYTYNTRSSIITVPQDKIAVVNGLRDYIVVDTDDVLMICPRSEEQSIKTLMEALVIVGILISFAGSSRPASGSEHHLSHFFEITGILDGTPYFPHGIDVAYSTVITAKLREKILSRPFPSGIYRTSPEIHTTIMNRIYQSAADGCIALQEKIGNYTADRGYLQKEDGIRAILAEMPTSDEIVQMLSLADLDIAEFYELYGSEKIENAILYAKDLKDRYTVLWMNYDFYGGDANVQGY